ncbi:IS1634 family transposase, partial [Turicimonas muris]
LLRGAIMGRPLSGVPHVGRRTETRKDGTKYIYERTTIYDPQTKKIKVLGCKLIGKILKGSNEIIKTRPKKPAAPKPVAPVKVARSHVGASEILDFVGKQSGIDTCILRSLPQAEALKAISLARYLAACDRKTLPGIETWQLNHQIPYLEPLTERVYGTLFEQLGRNESWIQNYFRHIASTLEKEPALALDSTTFSTYSTNLKEARYGFNKDADGLPTIKFVTLYSVKNRLPIAYCKQPGNIPDVISIQTALKQLSVLGVTKPLIVTDNGYYSMGNMVEFLDSNMKFLTLASRSATWLRDIVEEALAELDNLDNICPYDTQVKGKTVSKMQEFSRLRHRSTASAKAGETQKFSRRIYVHILRNSEIQTCKTRALEEELTALRSTVLSGEELSESAAKKVEKYLILSRQGRGGKLTVKFNQEAFNETAKFFGLFVLVSNKAQDCFEALEDYRLREKTEEAFGIYKEYCDGRKPRVWTGDRLRGRQFVQFIALSYRCWLIGKVREIKELLAKWLVEKEKKSEKSKAEKLLSWLDNRSLAQILDWFDCIEETTVASKAGEIRWKTESIERDKFFLSLLGMII